MGHEVGVACGSCDAFVPLGTRFCANCGAVINFVSAGPPDAGLVSPEAALIAKETSMDQARHYVCKECSTPVPSGHKFCGRCGAVVPPQILELRTDFFGAMQTPGKARLILIRGDAGSDGLS
ncbi:MAG TPA: zinc ribbon domain-containing protein, partial [Polyangiales bacterium]|nr:zinc ribbon domain-containing protein [Polyangiales bacterium]